MVKATQGVSRVDAVRQRARHILFVEGDNVAGFDVPVLRALLRNVIEVRPLGASYSIKSVAEALHPHHPDYYFLVDRDHHDDKVVETSWRKFPDRKTNNLLIWRRRELESYFLTSSYLRLVENDASAYVRRIKTPEEIDEIVRKECGQRLFLDVANQVIAEVREKNKAKWIQFFTNPAELPNAKDARVKLVRHPAFARKLKDLGVDTDRQRLEARFDEILGDMMGRGIRACAWTRQLAREDSCQEGVAHSSEQVFQRNRPFQQGC